MEIAIVALLVANLGLMGYLVWRSTRPAPKEDNQAMMLLQNQLQDMQRAMDSKLTEGTRSVSEFMTSQSDQARRLMSTITQQVSEQLVEVVKGVTETKESTKQVFQIADQLNNLEKVLKNQKQRGNLGEASLELVLSNILEPGMFEQQYSFVNGDKVDAIIHVMEGIIPVDAKFPLENYIRMVDESDDARRDEFKNEFRKDLKKRIDEAAKYIRPEERTLPFAFMFIPAEAIYYDVMTGDARSGVNARSLIDYAYNEKKVIIVSPTTFAAYLKSVIYGFKAFKIEKDAELIKKNVEALMKHLESFDGHMQSMGKAMGTAVSQYNLGYKEFNKIDKDILKITQQSLELDVLQLEKPHVED